MYSVYFSQDLSAEEDEQERQFLTRRYKIKKTMQYKQI